MRRKEKIEKYITEVLGPRARMSVEELLNLVREVDVIYDESDAAEF